MKCNYKARHFELEQNIVDYCEKRFQKVKKLLPENAFLEIEFIDEFGDKGGVDKRVEVTLDVPGRNLIHMENSSPDWHSAIDFLQDRLMDVLVDRKEKLIDSHRKPKDE